MILDAEAWLMALALGLYVQDAVLLLDPDEFVLERGRGGRWRPRFGALDWKLAGREPLVAPLLAPWRPLVRARWRIEDGLAGPRTPGGPVLPAAGRAVAVPAALGLLLLFVALPACLFLRPGLAWTASVAIGIYLSVAVALLLLARDRARLGLPRGAFASLCVESLCCPPYGLHAARKAVQRAGARVTLADVAAGDLDDAARAALHRAVRARVDEQLAFAPEGGERAARLRQARAALPAADDGDHDGNHDMNDANAMNHENRPSDANGREGAA